MSFSPAFENHSIERCELAIAVLPAFDAGALQLLRDVCTTWSKELPALRIVDTESIRGESILPLAPAQHNQSLKYSYFRPNGSPVWELIIASNEIRLVCTRYVSWSSVWSFAEEIFGTLLGALHKHASEQSEQEPSLEIAMTALRFVDRFESAEPPHDFAQVFKRGSKYLVPIQSEWKNAWNQSMAWFADEEHRSVLNSLNLSASFDSGTAPTRSSVLVEYTSQARFLDNGTLVFKEWTSDKGKSAFDSLHRLHALNKELLIDILEDEMLLAIGLSDNA